jgi:hypothetical protein
MLKNTKKNLGEKMTILLIKNPMRSWLWTNGIWIESLKLELQFHAQAQTIQLITTKMFDDILHVSKWLRYLNMWNFV